MKITPDLKVFSAKLQRILSEMSVVDETKGRVGDTISKLSHGGNHYFLKYGKGYSALVLKSENQVLSFLKNISIKVPEAVIYEESYDSAILLMTEVDGMQSQRKAKEINKEKVIQIVSDALKGIHMLNISGYTFSSSIDGELDEIEKFISQRAIIENDFISNNDGLTPSEGLLYLLKNKHILVENVFTHGDFCLPNTSYSRIPDLDGGQFE